MKNALVLFLLYFCLLVPSTLQSQLLSADPETIHFGDVAIDSTVTVGFTLTSTQAERQFRADVHLEKYDNYSLGWSGPRYQADIVMDVIFSVRVARNRYQIWHDNEEPESIEQLVELEYLWLDDMEASEYWDFSFVGSDPIRLIQAVSNENMSGGDGQIITWDLQEGGYTGYYTPSGYNVRLELHYNMRQMRSAYIRHKNNFGEEPESVYQLIERGSVWEDYEEIYHSWEFAFIIEDTIKGIEAVSKETYFDGAGHRLEFDFESGEYSDWYLPPCSYRDWFHEPHILYMAVSFTPSEEGEYESDVNVFIYEDGEVTDTLTIPITANGVLSVQDNEDPLPSGFVLHPAYPNPFNGMTRLDFTALGNQTIDLTVFTSTGRQVATLFHGTTGTASQTITWDASSQPAGYYIVRMTGGNEVRDRGVMLLK
ncbi:T9SS type A sorting domain-containing protein [Calditrichota bacterium]